MRRSARNAMKSALTAFPQKRMSRRGPSVRKAPTIGSMYLEQPKIGSLEWHKNRRGAQRAASAGPVRGGQQTRGVRSISKPLVPRLPMGSVRGPSAPSTASTAKRPGLARGPSPSRSVKQQSAPRRGASAVALRRQPIPRRQPPRPALSARRSDSQRASPRSLSSLSNRNRNTTAEALRSRIAGQQAAIAAAIGITRRLSQDPKSVRGNAGMRENDGQREAPEDRYPSNRNDRSDNVTRELGKLLVNMAHTRIGDSAKAQSSSRRHSMGTGPSNIPPPGLPHRVISPVPSARPRMVDEFTQSNGAVSFSPLQQEKCICTCGALLRGNPQNCSCAFCRSPYRCNCWCNGQGGKHRTCGCPDPDCIHTQTYGCRLCNENYPNPYPGYIVSTTPETPTRQAHTQTPRQPPDLAELLTALTRKPPERKPARVIRPMSEQDSYDIADVLAEDRGCNCRSSDYSGMKKVCGCLQPCNCRREYGCRICNSNYPAQYPDAATCSCRNNGFGGAWKNCSHYGQQCSCQLVYGCQVCNPNYPGPYPVRQTREHSQPPVPGYSSDRYRCSDCGKELDILIRSVMSGPGSEGARKKIYCKDCLSKRAAGNWSAPGSAPSVAEEPHDNVDYASIERILFGRDAHPRCVCKNQGTSRCICEHGAVRRGTHLRNRYKTPTYDYYAEERSDPAFIKPTEYASVRPPSSLAEGIETLSLQQLARQCGACGSSVYEGTVAERQQEKPPKRQLPCDSCAQRGKQALVASPSSSQDGGCPIQRPISFHRKILGDVVGDFNNFFGRIAVEPATQVPSVPTGNEAYLAISQAASVHVGR